MAKISLWETDIYYKTAGKGSENYSHPGMVLLTKLAIESKSKRILDIGCGEGTRLSYIAKDKKKAVGVDISKKAINTALKKHPGFKFELTSGDKLRFSGDSFDLVYSAFVLEHTNGPEKFIKEAIRVTKKGGDLVLITPNYGAPNRSSPCFKGSRLNKLISGFFADMKRLALAPKTLQWNEVSPIATKNNYEIDFDTTVEPYIGTLISFLKRNHVAIIRTDSLWSEELRNAKMHQKLFAKLSGLGIYPFTMWGPHILVHGKKQ